MYAVSCPIKSKYVFLKEAFYPSLEVDGGEGHENTHTCVLSHLKRGRKRNLIRGGE